MKIYNITPRNNRRNKKFVNDEMELLELNMTQGDKLEFDTSTKEDIYFKINLNFNKHTMSRVMCLN